jgi:hypothetical protein
MLLSKAHKAARMGGGQLPCAQFAKMLFFAALVW